MKNCIPSKLSISLEVQSSHVISVQASVFNNESLMSTSGKFSCRKALKFKSGTKYVSIWALQIESIENSAMKSLVFNSAKVQKNIIYNYL